MDLTRFVRAEASIHISSVFVTTGKSENSRAAPSVTEALKHYLYLTCTSEARQLETYSRSRRNYPSKEQKLTMHDE